MIEVGVLALQGDFAEHMDALFQCGVNPVTVRKAEELTAIQGLIIPGGESTAIAKLTDDGADPIYGAIAERAGAGMPIYGTCMGSIFLAKEIEGSHQGRLALMDIMVRRNAFGPQKHSFERDLHIPVLGHKPFLSIFIRAPVIVSCGPKVQVLAEIDQGIVMARQDNLLVTAFHPELTSDLRVHRYFLELVDVAARSRTLVRL